MACGGARAPGQIFAAMSTEMFQGGKRCGATVTGTAQRKTNDKNPDADEGNASFRLQ